MCFTRRFGEFGLGGGDWGCKVHVGGCYVLGSIHVQRSTHSYFIRQGQMRVLQTAGVTCSAVQAEGMGFGWGDVRVWQSKKAVEQESDRAS
jgi:hypothetical protein